jgi:hypothetical protein
MTIHNEYLLIFHFQNTKTTMIRRIILVLLWIPLSISAQKIQITGRVIGEDLEPTQGITIISKEEAFLDITDDKGYFSFEIENPPLYFLALGCMHISQNTYFKSKCNHYELVAVRFDRYTTYKKYIKDQSKIISKAKSLHRKAISKGIYARKRCQKK